MKTRDTRRVAALLVAGVALAACGSSATKAAPSSSTTKAADTTTAAAAATPTTLAAAGTTAAAAASGMTALVDACKKEGQVNLIALPDDWANYKGILESFRTKYGVKAPVASPDISSQEELDAIKNLKGQPDMPDSIDVSPAKAQDALTAGSWEPFKPSTFGDVPDNLKDASGNFVNAYYGIMAFGTNLNIAKTAPTSFADLKKPGYKGLVALSNDPRKSGEAFAAVMAASLANGGSADDIMPGIKYFAELKKSGNFIATLTTKATVLSGETPIAIGWSYNIPGIQAELDKAGIKFSTTFPADGVYGSPYAQGVIKGSPHQSCAKLWVEHILSDDGALGYLKGGAFPARYAAIDKAGKIDAAAKKNLPPADLVAKIKFLTTDQTKKANDLLQANWGPMVADA